MSQKAERRARTAALLADAERLDELFAFIAVGHSLRDYCEIEGVAYSTIQRHLADDDELRARYESARIMQAEACMDEIRELEDRIESGELNAKAGAVIIGSKQWRMERLNPKKYSPRSQQIVDVRQWDMAKLHADALKVLARRPRPAALPPAGDVQDAEVIDITPPAIAAPACPECGMSGAHKMSCGTGEIAQRVAALTPITVTTPVHPIRSVEDVEDVGA